MMAALAAAEVAGEAAALKVAVVKAVVVEGAGTAVALATAVEVVEAAAALATVVAAVAVVEAMVTVGEAAKAVAAMVVVVAAEEASSVDSLAAVKGSGLGDVAQRASCERQRLCHTRGHRGSARRCSDTCRRGGRGRSRCMRLLQGSASHS